MIKILSTGCKNGTGDIKHLQQPLGDQKMALATKKLFSVANWLPKNCNGDQNKISSSQLANTFFPTKSPVLAFYFQPNWCLQKCYTYSSLVDFKISTESKHCYDKICQFHTHLDLNETITTMAGLKVSISHSPPCPSQMTM